MTPVRDEPCLAGAPPPVAVPPAPGVEAVLNALADVRDPELDTSLVELGFVAGVEVGAGTVRVSLRLPTCWCAPNFAYLMVADARQAILAVPGVCEATVTLVDHFAADQLNRAVAAGEPFSRAFPEQAEGELDDLRTTFRRKALAGRQHRLCRRLLAQGWTAERLAGATLGEAPDTREAAAYRRARSDLGIAADAAAPLLVDEDGRPVRAEAVTDHLRRLRLVSVSVENNAAFCRGLLATRYAGDHDEVSGSSPARVQGQGQPSGQR